jgi:3-methyladenine DNA glycosylase Mpg
MMTAQQEKWLPYGCEMFPSENIYQITGWQWSIDFASEHAGDSPGVLIRDDQPPIGVEWAMSIT